MIWQDVLISVGSICFSIALIPMLMRGADRPPLFSVLFTSFWLYAFVIAFGTLGLWSSAATAGINGSMWLTVGFLKWRDI